MARCVQFLQQLLHGGDFIGLFVDLDMSQHQRRINGERAEHLFCLDVVEVIETALKHLAIERYNKRTGTRHGKVQAGGVFAKGFFNVSGAQPLQNIPDRRMGGRPFPTILKALCSFDRWTLMKVRMPRYELAPLTIAKIENSKTCGS